MDREHVKGAADKAKGAIKEAAGKVTGDKEAADRRQDRQDKRRGSQRRGDVKDAVRKADK